MSLYIANINVPPRTRPRLATSTKVEVHAKVVDAISVYFEDGCFNEIGVRFLCRDKQFSPWREGWVTGDDVTISWNEEYTLDGAPYVIEIETYNMAADYSHNIEVRLEVVNETIEMAISRLVASIDQFATGVRR